MPKFNVDMVVTFRSENIAVEVEAANREEAWDVAQQAVSDNLAKYVDTTDIEVDEMLPVLMQKKA